MSKVERENAVIVTLTGLRKEEVGYEEWLKHNLFWS